MNIFLMALIIFSFIWMVKEEDPESKMAYSNIVCVIIVAMAVYGLFQLFL